MPTKPAKAALNATTPQIMNAIRNDATVAYQQAIPAADARNVRDIGNILMGNPTFQNEFLSALVNRIGMVMVTSRLYSNPWNMFKKGILEFGETIEEIFVNIANVHTYNIERAETEVFKREIPDVLATFHILNYQRFYKATIQEEQLRQAFLSMDGVTDLIARIVDAMYTGANYDEFVAMKYMIARHILNGDFYPVTVPAIEADKMREIAAVAKGVSNSLEFMSDGYNMAGVATYTPKDRQYLIINAKADAVMDVNVLATSFNMDQATFMGHRVLIDSFGNLDTARLDMLFGDDPNYVPISQEELSYLDTIPAVIVDLDWFQIYDNMQKFTEIYNGQGLYWNYWFHTWKTFSVSPFANAVVLAPAYTGNGAPVTAVSVTPKTANVKAGRQVKFTAEATTADDAGAVLYARPTWSVSDTSIASVDFTGLVSIASSAPVGSSITVTATYANPKGDATTDTATITVGTAAAANSGTTTTTGSSPAVN